MCLKQAYKLLYNTSIRCKPLNTCKAILYKELQASITLFITLMLSSPSMYAKQPTVFDSNSGSFLLKYAMEICQWEELIHQNKLNFTSDLTHKVKFGFYIKLKWMF